MASPDLEAATVASFRSKNFIVHTDDDPERTKLLLERLETLGLTSCGDLELIDGTDLRPDLVSHFETMPEQLQDFAKDFPRVWSYQGAEYRVQAHPGKRLIVLEPANHVAKKAKDPPKSVLPRFRGFSVKYHGGGRQVTLR